MIKAKYNMIIAYFLQVEKYYKKKNYFLVNNIFKSYIF